MLVLKINDGRKLHHRGVNHIRLFGKSGYDGLGGLGCPRVGVPEDSGRGGLSEPSGAYR